MIFSYNWLQDHIKQELPKPEKLAEVLTMHFAEVENINKKGRDFVLDINIRPNRAGDCFSHWGVARECAAILKSKLNLPISLLKENQAIKAKDFIKIQVKDKKACPRYTARVITGVKVGPSSEWMKKRLALCGLQSINNIVDIANYVMLETGQPLHAFDARKLKGNKIIVRFAKKGEKIFTLDEQKFTLDKNVLVIADEKSPVAIAGIKGGKGPGIDKKTKTIVLESANFEAKIIRQGSKILNLKTDASHRFEHGIDPNLTEIAINRAAQLIQKFAKGKIAKGLVDAYPKKIKPRKIRLNIDYVEKLLGIKIPKKEIKSILVGLGFEVFQVSSSRFQVRVPTRRLDVSIQEDLIEEIGRIYGYEKIPSVLPSASMIPPQKNLEIFWEEFTKDILKENGFTEVLNYSFINQKNKQIFSYETKITTRTKGFLKIKELLEIENPISAEYQYLAPSLIPNLLNNVKDNFRFFDEIKIFEMGKIFKRFQVSSSKFQAVEKMALTGLIAQKHEKGNESFYRLKGVIDTLLEKIGISDSWYDEYKPTPEQSKILCWTLGKCAEIKIGNQEIGFLGEIAPKILKELKIKSPTLIQGGGKGRVVLFDIDFEKLQQVCSEECEYRPVSPYPAAIRDLAVLVPMATKVVQVLNIINQAGGKLVRDVDVFDIYEGEELPQGKKNFAFHIIYQAEDKTLTSKEIDAVHKKIVKAIEKNVGWEVRK